MTWHNISNLLPRVQQSVYINLYIDRISDSREVLTEIKQYSDKMSRL